MRRRAWVRLGRIERHWHALWVRRRWRKGVDGVATWQEFYKVAKLSWGDKTSGRRMRQILSVLKRYDVLHDLTPQKAVQVLEALGPTYVKIGQMASTRSDILPKEYCEAFEQLHADVTPMPFFQVLDCISRSYGHSWEETFIAIDPKPLGSASIAQVHRAVLLNGTVVAVKVRRPGIVEEMSEDIMLMRRLLATVEFVNNSHKTLFLNFDGLLDELERTTKNELDFRVELDNLIRFHAEIATQDGVTSPIPFPAVSNESVLVMQYVEGVQVDDVTALRAEGVDLNRWAYRIMQSYISQVLDDGFFHADPHPGNIIIKDREIIWIDLGMTGSLNPSQRQLVGRMFRSITSNDPYLLMESVIGISKKNGPVDYGNLLQELSVLLDKYGSSDLSDINIGDAMGEMVEVMRTQNLIMAPAVTMLVRGVVTLEGVMEDIAPTLNVLQIVSQHVIMQSLAPEHLEMRGLELLTSAAESAEALTKLPQQLSNTMEMLDRGEIALQGKVEVSPNVLATMYASVGRISLALISVGLFLGSSILCTTNMEPKLLEVPVLGVLGYLGAFVLGVYVIVQTFRTRHLLRHDRNIE